MITEETKRQAAEILKRLKIAREFIKSKLEKFHSRKTSTWEVMDPRTKNDSDKTQDIRMPYVGHGSRAEFDLLTSVHTQMNFW